MPLRTIASGNRVGFGGQRFPRLEFKSKGEFHRVLLFQKNEQGEPVVWQEYVHPLRVPLFNEDGTPKMTLKDSKRGDNEKYEDYDTESLGFPPICLGDAAVIEPEGFDAGACPICKRVPEAPAEAKLAPQLRFAVNVVEYALAPGTWKVQKPLSAKVVVWAFGPGVYDDILSQQEQHGDLLQKQDLTLEVVSPFDRSVKMGVMAPSGWTESPNGGAYLKELLGDPDNIASFDQLRAACGKDAKRLFMEDDVATVIKKWRKAVPPEEADLPSALGGGQKDLAAGVNELLDNNPAVARLAQETAKLKEETRKEVTEALSPSDPFSDLPSGEAARDTVTGNGTDPDPFGSAPAASTPGTAGSSGSASESSPPSDDPFGGAGAAPSGQQEQEPAAGESAASPPSAPPSEAKEKKPKSFDDLINSLNTGLG